MTIKQFNGTYQVNEDRLLFRFNTADDSEYRFWLTRRISLFILRATEQLLEKKLEQSHPPVAAKAIVQFQQKTMQEQADFSVHYEAATRFPLGGDPVLVIDVQCQISLIEKTQVLSLDLTLAGGAKINLSLAINTVHTMRTLIDKLVMQAQWNKIALDGDGTSSSQLSAHQSDALDGGIDDSPSDQAPLKTKKQLH